MLAAVCWSLSFVACNAWFALYRMLFVICRSICGVRCYMRVVRRLYVLSVGCNSVVACCGSVFVVWCTLLTDARCSLRVVRCWLVSVCCGLFDVCCLSLVVVC